MSKGPLPLALLLALQAGLFLADLALVPGEAFATAVYAVPILLAASTLRPWSVAAVAVAGGLLQVLDGALDGISPDMIAFDFAALTILGILAVALSGRMRRESELKRQAEEEREKFRFLTENTRDIIFRVDRLPTRRFTYVSPSMEDILGYAPEELYADPNLVQRFVHPEDLPALQRLAADPLPERTLTFRALHRAGHTVWLEQRNIAIYDTAGRVVGYEGVVRDVTERKRAEEEMLRSKAELEAVFRALPDLLLRLDREGRVVDYKADRLAGTYPGPEYLLGRRVEEVFPEEVAKRLASAMDMVRAMREMVTVDHGLTLPGGDRVYESRLLPFLEDQILLVVRDVTDRAMLLAELRVAREAAERETAQLDATFQSMADPVMIYDTSGAILRANAAADRVFGFTAEQRSSTIERRVAELGLLDEEGRPFPGDRAPARLALQGQTVTGVTMVVRHPATGKTVWLSTSAGPIRNAEGRLLGAVTAFTEVTALHELQERLRDLVRSLSHDLKSPLTAVLGQGQILKMKLEQRGDDRSLIASAASIAAGAKRMNEMIDQLTEATRIESGQLPVNRQPLDLARFLVDLVGGSVHSLDVGRIVLEAPSGLPPALADPSHLERILTNLLSNALKYSKPGTPVVVRAEAADGFVRVSVIDRGPGIAPEDLPRLFDRFYRARRTARAEGLGMGLYIAKALAEAQGGRLSVETKVGEGTTFAVSLPTG